MLTTYGMIVIDGLVARNPDRPLIVDLDAFPFPARDLIGEPDRYLHPAAAFRRKPVDVVLTSRGCNRKCIYCFQLDKVKKRGIPSEVGKMSV